MTSIFGNEGSRNWPPTLTLMSIYITLSCSCYANIQTQRKGHDKITLQPLLFVVERGESFLLLLLPPALLLLLVPVSSSSFCVQSSWL
eukprot:m.202288 g.202288  ORF g.202288 m.202288 type:complete len:88 (+) comp25981_c0_seq3:7428-7691(+)